MRLLGKIIIVLLGNIVGLYLSSYFIKNGFYISPTIEAYLKIGLILTAVHIFIRPILKIVLSPIIFITLGLGIIVVNALILYIIDYALPELTISGLYPLVYATLIIGIISFFVNSSQKSIAKSE